GHEPGARLYKTGDMARFRADANLEFIGRRDNQVKVRGYRIETEEIRSVLGRHPDVRQAAVMAREEKAGDKRLVAYVAPNPQGASGARLTAAAPRDFLEQELPEYMIPGLIILLEALPLTSNGKVDYKALSALDHGVIERSAEFVAPRTLEEEMLAAI